MRGDDGGRVDHGVAERLRVLAQARARSTPLPCRRPDRASRGRSAGRTRGPGLMASSRSGCTTLSPMGTPREPDAIAVGPQIEVVADVHRRHEEAELLRELAAHAADARQQVAALGAIDQRHEAIAHFEADEVHRLHVFPGQLLLLRRDGGRRRLGGASSTTRPARASCLSCQAPQPASAAIERNAKFGMPGIRPMTPSTAGRDAERLRLAEQLLAAARRPCPVAPTCG